MRASIIPLRAKQLAILEERLDWGEFIEHISAGETQGSYANSTGIHGGTLSLYLAQLDPVRAQQLAIARKARAESCLDKALEQIERGAVDSEITGEVTLAVQRYKAYAQRAALSDRANYHDRPPVETGPVLSAPPAFTIQILNAPGSSSEVRIVQTGEAPAALEDGQLDLI